MTTSGLNDLDVLHYEAAPHEETADLGPKDDRIRKLIVAVHGIGDQFKYATIQSVVAQFCRFYGEPFAVPLGSFHLEKGQPIILCPPYSPERFSEIAFTEVYWAEIPRVVVREEHTLEEAKMWARTIVERLQLRGNNELRELEARNDKHAHQCSSSLKEMDYALVKQVLCEMIQTIAILERLFYLAERAGLFTFNLRRLLDNYLGDVQVVTEFKNERKMILDTFQQVMKQAHQFAPNAEIYVVAHSEGTVVAFLGLLDALADEKRPDWIGRVRGLMTLGSPLDKHLLLWPRQLWARFEKPDFRSPSKRHVHSHPAERAGRIAESAGDNGKSADCIQWYNYYDFGDPVGFKLDETRAWLCANDWCRVFDFNDQNDIGFSRYSTPGKAHVDYWKDEEVFGHFIENVVLAQPPAASKSEPRFPKPGNKLLARVQSWVVPYLAVGALLFAAVFILYKAFNQFVDPTKVESGLSVFRDVMGMACLLYGVTVSSRIPRLTTIWQFHLLSPIFFILSAGIYFLLLPGGTGLKRFAMSLGVLTIVTMIGWIRKSRSYGFKPLIWVGGVFITITIIRWWSFVDSGERGPIWPLILATLAFLYMWWLAALIFDLIFVWHRYIRFSTALNRMGKVVASPCARHEWEDQERAGGAEGQNAA